LNPPNWTEPISPDSTIAMSTVRTTNAIRIWRISVGEVVSSRVGTGGRPIV
jgi:hypothetical protein